MAIGISVGIGLGIATAIGIIVSHLHPPGVPRPRKWASPPTVVVLDDRFLAPTSKSVARFRAIGHKFAGVYGTDMTSAFTSPGVPRTGLIVIGLAGPEADRPTDSGSALHPGRTKVFGSVDRKSDITGAFIELVSDLKADEVEKVVAHEIGHALGYEHSDLTGSLMNRRLPSMGWDMRGLEGP